MEKLVSILIPVYNREKLIARAIESSKRQTYANIEIIIADNCSTDGTWQVLQDYAAGDDRIKIFRNETNIGPVKNWLRCVEESRGDYVKILFSDDWMDDDFISKAVQAIESNHDVAFVFSKVQIVFEDGQQRTGYDIFPENTIFSSRHFITLAFLNGNISASPGSALFRRRDVAKNLLVEFPNDEGLVFNNLGAGNDLFLHLMTAYEYKNLAYLSDTSCYFLSHRSSFTMSTPEGLGKYHNYAKLYFINQTNDQFFARIFKSFLIVQSKNQPGLYKKVPGRWSLWYVVRLSLRKMISIAGTYLRK
ncbi:MAG: glycosyltransferase [Ignavibacteria bacterium]|nr:glycosyltransferase [Ignavibacteria bacterium]